MRLGIPDDGVKPADSTQKKHDIISDKFGEGFNGQIPMLINVKDKKMIHKDYNKIYSLYIKILKIRKCRYRYAATNE